MNRIDWPSIGYAASYFDLLQIFGDTRSSKTRGFQKERSVGFANTVLFQRKLPPLSISMLRLSSLLSFIAFSTVWGWPDTQNNLFDSLPFLHTLCGLLFWQIPLYFCILSPSFSFHNLVCFELWRNERDSSMRISGKRRTTKSIASKVPTKRSRGLITDKRAVIRPSPLNNKEESLSSFTLLLFHSHSSVFSVLEAARIPLTRVPATSGCNFSSSSYYYYYYRYYCYTRPVCLLLHLPKKGHSYTVTQNRPIVSHMLLASHLIPFHGSNKTWSDQQKDGIDWSNRFMSSTHRLIAARRWHEKETR